MPSKNSSDIESSTVSTSNPSRRAQKEHTPRGRWTKPLEWWGTRQLIRLLNLVGRCTPRSFLTPLGRFLGMAAYYTMPRYRKVAHGNLQRAYGGQWDEAGIERVAKDSFRHIGITMVEFFLRQPRITPQEVEREVRFEGREHYEAAFARGKGVILITAHYGNWEMMGPRLIRAGYKVSAVSRTADDPGLESMIESIRTRCGLQQIPRQQAARQGLAALRRNEILAILLDQNTAEGGLFVPFYGYPASTATGPAVFGLKTGAAIVPTFCVREPDGSHTMRAWPPIYPEATGDRQADIHRLTAAITRVIEQQIRERPELWCWLHNRWKMQPPRQEPEPDGGACASREKGPSSASPASRPGQTDPGAEPEPHRGLSSDDPDAPRP
jgi:Kdo2-lipid IVA lauroyltransferase/acyltransferase